MNTALDCILCLVHRAAEAVRLSFAGVSQRSDLMRCVLSEVASANIFGISRETPGTVGEMINAGASGFVGGFFMSRTAGPC